MRTIACVEVSIDAIPRDVWNPVNAYAAPDVIPLIRPLEVKCNYQQLENTRAGLPDLPVGNNRKPE